MKIKTPNVEICNKAASLIIKYRKTGLNEQEQMELDEWIGLSVENRRTFELLTDKSYVEELNKINKRVERKKIKQMYETDTGEKFPIRNNTGYYIAATIIILLIVGAVILSIFN